jgi:SAM-dependent methyltransferase
VIVLSDQSIWDRYWQFDRIASCFDGAGATNYDESIAEPWRAFFRRLTPGARILDLCTGNGAAALIAAEVARTASKGFTVTAVDRADIDPGRYVTRHVEDLAAIRFVGRTDIEALPFADAGFDVVISQYGIEYADLDRAVSELVRVLAAGGQTRLVVHAADGIVAAGARDVIADADLLLGDIALIEATRHCLDSVTAVERGLDPSPEAKARADSAFAGFQDALARTARHVPAATDKVMFRNSGGVMLNAFQSRGHVTLDEILAKVDQVEAEILAHRGRLQALVDAALDESGAEALAARLRAAGAVSATSASLGNAQGRIGHVVEAHFPA